jgi:hypothetical protein
MSIGLDAARDRLLAYMVQAGATATISRKQLLYGEEGLPIGESWEPVAVKVPLLVETRRAAAGQIDPAVATADEANRRELTLPHDTDLRPGDRLTATAPRGTGISPLQVLTVSAIAMHSLAPGLGATATIEENAVEQYAVTIERWDDAAGEYAVITTQTAWAVTGRPGLHRSERGAAGARVTGTLIFEPVPAATLVPGDTVLGIPWASGATLTRLHPIVGSRLEASFHYTLGEAS